MEPDVIDNDYTGEIKIIPHSTAGISVIQSGQRLTCYYYFLKFKLRMLQKRIEDEMQVLDPQMLIGYKQDGLRAQSSC